MGSRPNSQPIGSMDGDARVQCELRYPIAGIVTRSDLLRAIDQSGSRRKDPLISISNASLVVAYPDELVSDVVARMLSHGVGRLPVISRAAPEEMIGYLSRTSLLSTRLSVLHEESKREDGWIRSWKR